jgi:hypothetical protein
MDEILKHRKFTMSFSKERSVSLNYDLELSPKQGNI